MTSLFIVGEYLHYVYNLEKLVQVGGRAIICTFVAVNMYFGIKLSKFHSPFSIQPLSRAIDADGWGIPGMSTLETIKVELMAACASQTQAQLSALVGGRSSGAVETAALAYEVSQTFASAALTMRGGKLTTSLEIRQMSSGNRHSLSWH